MFSSDTIVSMANGTFKNINHITVNDMILDKLNTSVRVVRTSVHPEHICVGIQLNNGTGVFYCDPNVKFLCHNILNNGNVVSQYSSISSINEFSGISSKLKSSSKVFSNQSDVSITTYNDPTDHIKKDLYCLYTNDGTQTFYVNKVITMCDM